MLTNNEDNGNSTLRAPSEVLNILFSNQHDTLRLKANERHKGNMEVGPYLTMLEPAQTNDTIESFAMEKRYQSNLLCSEKVDEALAESSSSSVVSTVWCPAALVCTETIVSTLQASSWRLFVFVALIPHR